jgi:hypothetical protein
MHNHSFICEIRALMSLIKAFIIKMRKTVEIDGTINTPGIEFRSGKLSITGRSILENSTLFYQPLCDLLEEYDRRNGKLTQVDLNFEYLNCSSTRCLAAMLRTLEKIFKGGNIFVINWYYTCDDESMRDTGQVMKSLTSIPFNILEICNGSLQRYGQAQHSAVK